jgi:hypothetical protein
VIYRGVVAPAPFVLLTVLLAQGSTPVPDFPFFRDRVQPIFLAKHLGHARCYICHSRGTAFRLQPLAEGETTWSEEESRKNFDAARRFVIPGSPLRSRLLLMALAEEAGGAPFHPGGKHWESQDDPDWKTLAAWVESAPAKPAASTLDYAVYRSKVEPVFLAKRAGHARCVVCHSRGTAFRLQALSPGSSGFSEEQSRKNFEAARRMVIPGNPAGSRLLLMPLAEDAGGTPFHPGGKHWESQGDPEWQALAEWVRGAAR